VHQSGRGRCRLLLWALPPLDADVLIAAGRALGRLDRDCGILCPAAVRAPGASRSAPIIDPAALLELAAVSSSLRLVLLWTGFRDRRNREPRASPLSAQQLDQALDDEQRAEHSEHRHRESPCMPPDPRLR